MFEDELEDGLQVGRIDPFGICRSFSHMLKEIAFSFPGGCGNLDSSSFLLVL
jgi:hypothetical protein